MRMLMRMLLRMWTPREPRRAECRQAAAVWFRTGCHGRRSRWGAPAIGAHPCMVMSIRVLPAFAQHQSQQSHKLTSLPGLGGRATLRRPGVFPRVAECPRLLRGDGVERALVRLSCDWDRHVHCSCLCMRVFVYACACVCARTWTHRCGSTTHMYDTPVRHSHMCEDWLFTQSVYSSTTHE